MLAGILLFLGLWYITSGDTKQETFGETLRNLSIMLVLATCQWLVVHRVLVLLRRRYAHYSKILTRAVLAIIISGLLGMVVAAIVYGIPMLIAEHRVFSFALFSVNFGPMFFFSALIVAAEEVVYNFHELRRIDREKEELKKAHLQSQLDSLKTQVNPHFLFNSLNTLLSLIPAAPRRAEQFVIELSAVYRYLLQASEHQLTSLEKELQFAQSYFHLLKTRFEEGIRLELDIDPQYLEYQLPSLTLQLLLENAVKHNQVSASRPLTISLCTLQDAATGKACLTVQNNLQRKTQSLPSTQMGLNNIMSKFRLLNHEELIITDKDDHFTVTVPLFKTQPV